MVASKGRTVVLPPGRPNASEQRPRAALTRLAAMADQKADLQKLQSAAGEVTQEACMRNVTRDIREEEKAEHAQQLADWKASQKTRRYSRGQSKEC